MVSISIIIPIHNVESYVRQCLESMKQRVEEVAVVCILRLPHVAYMLLSFPPLSMLQQWSVFRRNYYCIETIVLRVSHLTDFLLRKNIL